MKISIAAAGIFAAGGTLSACSSNNGNDTQASTANNDEQQVQGSGAASNATSSGKVLVAYYSAQGHTKRVAEAAADELGADLFEIVPAEVYTDDDLNWTNDQSRVTREYEDESLRDTPLAQTTPDNWADYDTVLLGYPIWWAIAAWPCNHFATDNDFTGKKVIPFCTSASSGLGQSGKLLAEAAGTGDWQDGQRFSSGASDSEVRTWTAGI
ncbi:flavodoxin [Paratractidigestivibacter sp.]|uniref:flavodoxin n=1 Tax=Paratractidigestivibacter sp. TaxID=2847316 RepID=UPI002AC9D445|nr:flavodoxin [Paratractidigestivibacter sp.]